MEDSDFYDELEVRAARRRARYNSDPEFRARVLKHSMKWQAKAKAEGRIIEDREGRRERERLRRAAAREQKEQQEIHRKAESYHAHRAMKNKYGAKNNRDYLQRLKDHGVKRMSEVYEKEREAAMRLLEQSRARRRARSSQ